MSETNAAALPSPRALAAGLANAVPRDLAHSPILGILGVAMGAGVVTLTGRLLSLGLADLKGNVGISYDDGAWISSAFNVALMFVAVFTVYLGALIGPRKVLFYSAGVFTLVSLYLPFVHNYSLLLVLLAVAGFTSGTFYPLTLTFALRGIPLKYLPYTVALYATSVEAGVNFAPSLYGFERDHLSWHWMFWTAAVITPLMMLCIYLGIPPAAPRPKSEKPPSFEGVLYSSLGFATLFAALDQGERLDWWRSGLFTVLMIAGVFFIVCSLVRRMEGPNPLVDLPYLYKRNTVLCGILLGLFRFSLLGTIIVVPTTLATIGLDIHEYAPAVLGTAMSELVIGFIVAYLLANGTDPRVPFAFGFACTGLACWVNSHFTVAWAAENYYRTELLMGAGQTMAFVGLVGTILLQGLFTGGLAKPQRILTFSSFFHTVRLFGGQVGAVAMSHFIPQREKFHSNLLGLHVQRGEWITDANVRGLTAAMAPKSSGLGAAAGRAAEIVGGRVRLEAYALTFGDAFLLITWACVVALGLIALLKTAPMDYRELSEVQTNAETQGEVKR
jgi:MFS transporter, DHA2 family, multidrug resistance protein